MQFLHIVYPYHCFIMWKGLMQEVRRTEKHEIYILFSESFPRQIFNLK